MRKRVTVIGWREPAPTTVSRVSDVSTALVLALAGVSFFLPLYVRGTSSTYHVTWSFSASAAPSILHCATSSISYFS
jgi:hypothetical protein